MNEKPSPSPALKTYLRLQRWRRRERARWPGLFRDTLVPVEAKHKVTLQKLRTGHFRIHIDDVPIVICNACGALLKRNGPLASSDSTLPPPSQDAPDASLQCPVCCFVTPLSSLCRLMNLPNCGPDFDQSVALSLLVEAVGVETSIKEHDPELHSWFLDRGCRMAGLDALLGITGMREEQLSSAPLSDSLSYETPILTVQDMLETERFITATIPASVISRLPYSVVDLQPSRTHLIDEGRLAAERAGELVAEAARLWRTELCSTGQSSAMIKIQALGREFLVEQAKARVFNHCKLNIPQTVQVTQPPPPSQPHRSQPQPSQPQRSQPQISQPQPSQPQRSQPQISQPQL